MKPKLTQWLCVWWCFVCVFATGCGGGVGEPKFSSVLAGKVTRGGQPLQVNKAQHGDYANVQVVFIPLDKGSASISTTAAEDGTFQVELAEGQTISPGKYRIAVYQWNPQPERDELGGKFSEENSPIEREITGEGETINIDLSEFGGG